MQNSEHVQRVIARLQADQISTGQARIQINDLLRTFSQVEWWGQASDLLTDDSDFARELGEWYRHYCRLEPVDASPVAAVKAQDFFQALQVFGV